MVFVLSVGITGFARAESGSGKSGSIGVDADAINAELDSIMQQFDSGKNTLDVEVKDDDDDNVLKVNVQVTSSNDSNDDDSDEDNHNSNEDGNIRQEDRQEGRRSDDDRLFRIEIETEHSGSKVEVRGWDMTDKREITDARAVRSGDDLRSLISTRLEADKHIARVRVRDDEVRVRYSIPSRFLGIFPTTVPVEATAGLDARVKIKFPWYRFLFGGLDTREALSVDIQNAIDTAGIEIIDDALLDDASDSALESLINFQARILQAISSSFNERYQVQVSGERSGN